MELSASCPVGKRGDDPMGALSEDVIARVRDASDIVDVISNYVILKPQGQRLVGLCPFHTERTPSFSVSPAKQLFYCFGCGAGGNVFNFVMRIENLSFVEAVRFLADRAGIRVEDDAETPEQKRARKLREDLFRISEFAAKYFEHVLWATQQGRRGLEYFRARGLSDELMRRFRLGYSLPNWRAFAGLVSRREIPIELALRAGLVIADKTGGKVYDRFRDRVMFAILDVHGRPVGFGGRVLDSGNPKYINSPETEIFSKRHNLYGIHVAKDRMRETGVGVIVEGYMDVLAAHQFGIDNVVASLGTSLTAEQGRMLARYAREVIICYDADAAGEGATLRGMEILSSAGLSVRVAPLPKGHDPDSLIRQSGPEAFRKVLEESVPLTRYGVEAAVAGIDTSSVEGKVEAAKRLVPALARVSNAVEREELAGQMAQRLGIEAAALGAELRRYLASHRSELRRRGGAEDRGASARHTSEDGAQDALVASLKGVLGSPGHVRAERELVGLMLVYPEVGAEVRKVLGTKWCRIPDHLALLETAGQLADQDLAGGAGLLDRLADPRMKDYAASLLMQAESTPKEGVLDHARNLITGILRFQIQARMKEIQDEIARLERQQSAGEAGEEAEIPSRIRELWAELADLRSRLGKDSLLY